MSEKLTFGELSMHRNKQIRRISVDDRPSIHTEFVRCPNDVMQRLGQVTDRLDDLLISNMQTLRDLVHITLCYS